jgi:hypothetical protein
MLLQRIATGQTGVVMDKVRKGDTVVVPHGGQERLPHLAQGLANLRQCDEITEIVVFEMDYRPAAEDVPGVWPISTYFSARTMSSRNLDISTSIWQ